MRLYLLKLSDWIITSSFFLLFLLIPFLLTPFNYELFEYNKMMAVYALTIIITAWWITKMFCAKSIKIRRSPFDLPLLLFLTSQVAATIFSIDVHVSIFGYYSRFNGGLLSSFSYIILYYAFLTNFKKESVSKLLLGTLISATIIAIWATLEHFGYSLSCLFMTSQFNDKCWIQDVQNRVFATLGQPNWLAAYLAVLIPLLFAWTLNKFQDVSKTSRAILFTMLTILFYTTLIYTKSRSGFLGIWISLIILGIFIFIKYSNQSKLKNISFHPLKLLGILYTVLLLVSFFIGTTFSQLDRFTWSGLTSKNQNVVAPSPSPTGSSALETGVTESGTIRKIVWKGALDIIKHYPLFGSGVETFAFSYYKYRPIEHNMTSEWDFLYNKAHNEYLNYAATTGLFGLGTYLLFIFSIIAWNIIKFLHPKDKLSVNNGKIKNDKDLNIQNSYSFILSLGLFTGWFSILVTNFLGFSVVVIQILFYLIPAILVLLTSGEEKYFQFPQKKENSYSLNTSLNYKEIFAIILCLGASVYFILILINMWRADTAYALSYNQDRAGDFVEGYRNIKAALNLNPNEVVYYDELSLSGGELALLSFEQKDATLSSVLQKEAILSSNITISISPNNVNFWKNRTRVFYTLSSIDPKYYPNAINSLIYAQNLSPTDPKISYNLGLLYGKIAQNDKAIESLKRGIALKPDYREAHFALALFYKDTKQIDKAKSELQFILTKISTSDGDAKNLMEELNK